MKTRGMKTEDGKIEHDWIANIWKAYYHQVLNEKEDIHTKAEDTLTEEEENEVKCSLETEVQEEIRNLRNNKAPGNDGPTNSTNMEIK